MVTIEQVFLPYALMRDNKQLYEHVTHVVQGIFGLAVPPKRVLEPCQQVRTLAP